MKKEITLNFHKNGKNMLIIVHKQYKKSHEKNNTVVKVTPPSKNIVIFFVSFWSLFFGQPEKVVMPISLPN